MEQAFSSILLIVFLFALLGGGLWVAMSLFMVGFLGMVLFSSAPVGLVLATTVWGASNSWALAALPMFIWMGEILFRSKLSEDLFQGVAPWLGWLPGRLIHINIIGSAIFAAVSGSSAATAATIGRMSLPELEKRGYDKSLAIGSLAGSSTLGFLIPPSIILIVYGVATDQSIGRLFIAGILPGLMLVILFMGFVVIYALIYPHKFPPREPSMPFLSRIYAARRLIPILVLISGVIGSIYFGIASPTDAAALGVVLSLLLSWAYGTLNWDTFKEGLLGATKTSCMIAFILAGAAFLSVSMGFAGIPRELAIWIGSYNLSPFMLLAALTLFFIVLGCFLDGISIVVLTTSVILPMVEGAGIDLIWFGIYLVIVVEMSQITPPVGFNLFVLQGLTGKDILSVARSALPFFALLVVAVVLLTTFPEIATYLPEKMTSG
jgi:C4-dicarboxylate transporter, DctM subunit